MCVHKGFSKYYTVDPVSRGTDTVVRGVDRDVVTILPGLIPGHGLTCPTNIAEQQCHCSAEYRKSVPYSPSSDVTALRIVSSNVMGCHIAIVKVSNVIVT